MMIKYAARRRQSKFGESVKFLLKVLSHFCVFGHIRKFDREDRKILPKATPKPSPKAFDPVDRVNPTTRNLAFTI